MLRTMRQNNPHLAIELNVSRIKEDVALHNTNGGEAHLSRSWLEAETWIERHADGEVLVALDRFATAQVDDSHLDFARRMARRFRWARKPIEPVSGPQSVIFSPSAFASLLEPMLMAFNGSFAFNTNSRGGKRRSGFASKTRQAGVRSAVQPVRRCHAARSPVQRVGRSRRHAQPVHAVDRQRRRDRLLSQSHLGGAGRSEQHRQRLARHAGTAACLRPPTCACRAAM